MNREFLMLAKTYDPLKHQIAGWYASIKCDGQRAFWDGGVTRGLPKSEVPWANTAKDERLINPPVSTGLWSRYGNAIQAPDWWIDLLPTDTCLDGELYMGRGLFQQTRSITSKQEPHPADWGKIRFMVFDRPSPLSVFCSGRINNPQFVEKVLDEDQCLDLYKHSVIGRATWDMGEIVAAWEGREFSENWEPLEQRKLSDNEEEARSQLWEILDQETSQGGEGVILRSPYHVWTPKRANYLLKVKPLLDSEGVVKGFTDGEGKLKGMLGALIVQWEDKIFELSGFTEEERRLEEDGTHSVYFPPGTPVSFKYTGLTDDGIPREARYWRK